MSEEPTLQRICEIAELDPFLRLGPPAPKELPGWEYRDFYAMPKDTFKALIEAIGADNIKPIAFTLNGNKARGQFWISPDGLKAMEVLRKGVQ